MGQKENKCVTGIVTAITVTFIITAVICTEEPFSSVFTNPDYLVAITSLLNIALVITFFSFEVSRRNKEYIASRKTYWFRQLGMEENIERINNLFSSELMVIDDIFDMSRVNNFDLNNHLAEYMHRNSVLRTQVNERLFDIISVIDLNLGDKILDFFIDYQDSFINKLAELPNKPSLKDCKEIKDTILLFKRKLLRLLYIYDVEGIIN